MNFVVTITSIKSRTETFIVVADDDNEAIEKVRSGHYIVNTSSYQSDWVNTHVAVDIDNSELLELSDKVSSRVVKTLSN